MDDQQPLACSLEASELPRRLAAIAKIGAEALLSRDVEGDRHLLRFQADPRTRHRLEGIVAAEAQCCAFLDLSLGEEGGALVLSIAAPADGQVLAAELAAAFGP